MPNPRQGKVLFGLWLTTAESDSLEWSLNNATRLLKKWERLRENDSKEEWLNDHDEETLENAQRNIQEILITAHRRGDVNKR